MSKTKTKAKPIRQRAQTEEMRIEYMPLSTLLRAPRNPKQHDIGLIHESFAKHGYVEPIVVNEGTGRLVAGHGRLDTLQQAKARGDEPPRRVQLRNGEWFVPVLRGVDFATDHDAEAYLLVSNQAVIAGGWSDGELTKVLADLAAANMLDGTGFDADDVDKMLRAANPAPVEHAPGHVRHTCPSCGHQFE